MIKKLPKSQIEISIEVSWEDWKKYLDQAASEISEEIKIAGFRPGKAPRNLVEQKVGKGMVMNNAAEKAVKKSYVDFITSEKLEVIGTPSVEIKEIEEGKDLKYKATVAVMPELEISEKYHKDIKEINAEFKEKKADADESEVKLELEKLANSRVKLVTVARETKSGDSVEIDFVVKVGGVPIENGTGKKHPLIVGRNVFIPGFEENLIGMKEGDEKEFELKFPDDYHKKDLAGNPATFSVKMLLVQDRQTPEINDEFAKSIGNFKDIDDLRKNIKEGIEHEKEHKIADEKRTKYIEAVIENTKTELPDIIIDQEVRKMMDEFEHQLQPMGMNLDQYLEKIGKKRDELATDWKEQARKRVMSALILQEIAKKEGLAADSKEIEAEMNKTLSYYKKVKDVEKNIDMERLYNYSKGVLENEKVFEFLEKI